MQSSTPSDQQCTICGTKTEQRCKTCNCSLYCSKQCQKADWSVHKLLCCEFPKFLTPPNAAARRAILFPDDGQGPKFVWVPTVGKDEYGSTDEKVNFDNYIGTDRLLRMCSINRNVPRGRVLQYPVAVFYRDAYLVDGSRTNSGLVAATRGRLGHDWRGPILVMKLSGDSMYSTGYLNTDTVDFRDAIDYFLSYPSRDMNDSSPIPTIPRNPAANVLGVRINCNGDQKLGGRAKFEAITLPGNHAVLSAPVCEISTLVGFPIHLLPCPETIYPPPEGFNESNSAATFIQMGVDPDRDDWGFAPMQWQISLGSAIVVRADREKLWPEHVDALCYFCRFVLQPLFGDSTHCGFHPKFPISKQSVLNRITPREYELFFTGYRNSKKDSSFKWDNTCPHPF